MRRQAILMISLWTTINAVGQDVKIERSTEKDLLISPYNIHSVREVTDSSHIAIKVIELQSTIGLHPDNIGQDVVLTDFLFLVRERFDNDQPDASGNFWVRGEFYNPRDFKLSKSEKLLTFKHGTERNMKTTTLFVSAKEITIR